MNAPTRLLRLWSVLALLAWTGLIGLVNVQTPTPPALTAAAALLLLAVTTTSAPLWLLMARRLTPTQTPAHQARAAWRRGLLTGLAVVLLALLRILGLLDGVLAALVVIALILVEKTLAR
ncbi:MAG: hypothetical protein RMN24_10010 [Anaerolineae bacterium]|nr:hypothetical protein [Caldilineales bacterium]MCX7851728.1 hypothetical protein [Caldilineales bacterium]MDW8269488.1 hypothetical protein [Anaerolineae bacterium]